MKTTVEIDDELFREAKLEAVRRGVTLRRLIEMGLEQVVKAGESADRGRVDFPLIRSAPGARQITPDEIYQALADMDAAEDIDRYADSIRR